MPDAWWNAVQAFLYTKDFYKIASANIQFLPILSLFVRCSAAADRCRSPAEEEVDTEAHGGG